MKSEELTLTPSISSEELQVIWVMERPIGENTKKSTKLISGVVDNSFDVHQRS
jgi:hypothetical protein